MKKRRLPRSRSPMSPLRKYRRAHGLTLAEMATLLECSATTLHHVERGLRSPGGWLTRAILNLCGDRIKIEDLHGELTLDLPETRRVIEEGIPYTANWNPPQDYIDFLIYECHIADLVAEYEGKLRKELK
jgi:DNA-binding XRE family transcriptional regulator